ncbi:MAG TPA: AAA family ATPase [Gemmataceae bacterium]|nr:AAA family ATPase [Gemmataceae bacterium]
MSSLLAQLLEYRRLGWAVVPACPPDHRGVKPVHTQSCNAPGETPLFAWRSYEDQLPTEGDLRAAAQFAPAGCNLCLILGRTSGVLVLETAGSFAAWCEAQGQAAAATVLASGPAGKERAFFRLERGEAVATQMFGASQGIEPARVWSQGTYLLLPPGNDRHAFLHEWREGCAPRQRQVAPCPDWLRERLGMTRTTERVEHSAGSTEYRVPSAPEYESSSTEYSVLGTGSPPRTAGQEANVTLPPPSSPAIDALPSPAPPPNTDGFVVISEVAPCAVPWVWPGWIPAGKITVLDGDPGAGKSTLLIDLAARLSRGRAMPDGQAAGPAAVILLTAEDNLADTVRPRLEAADADLARCHSWRAVEGSRQLLLPRDLGLLERRVQETGARLLIVDPFFAFLDGRLDGNRDQHVRICLSQLSGLCERHNLAAVLVRHLTKRGPQKALYRGGGSIGIIGSARAGLLLARDPERPTGRILAGTKRNLAEGGPSLALHLETVTETGTRRICRVVWDGPCQQDADQLLAPAAGPNEQGRLREAVEFLRTFLGSCPRSATEVFRVAATAGVTPKTLRRAKEVLGVYSEKDKYNFEGHWHWVLPGWKSSFVVKSIAEIGRERDEAAAEAAAALESQAHPTE